MSYGDHPYASGYGDALAKYGAGYNPTQLATIFDLQPAPALGRLSATMRINGTDGTPVFRYFGKDATATDWPDDSSGGNDLTLVGTESTIDRGLYLPTDVAVDRSVKFNGSAHYEYTGASIETYDAVLEIVMAPGANLVEKHVIGSWNGTSGWGVTCGANKSTYNLFGHDGTGFTTVAKTKALSYLHWHHLIAFIDRSGSMVWYVNNEQQTAVVAGRTGSWSLSNRLRVGKTNFAGYDRLAYAALWTGENWLDSHLQADVVKERFASLQGLIATCKGTPVPTAMARASSAAVERMISGKRRIFYVGDDWIRTSDTPSDGAGIRVEPESDNDLLYSEELDDASWVLTRATISADGAEGPDGEMTADGIVSTAVSNTHSVGQAIASVATTHVLSVFAKPGDKDWAYLDIPSVANANAYFDLANGAIGTVGAGATAFIDGPYWQDYYRCRLVYTGGVPSHSHDIYPAVSDGNRTFTGDGSTVDIWIWGVMHEDEGHAWDTSYVQTEGSSVTRAADTLRYKGDDGNLIAGKGTIKVTAWMQDADTDAIRDYFTLSDGGSANDRISAYESASDVVVAQSREAVGDPGDVTSSVTTSDGALHTVQVCWSDGSLRLWIDGVLAGTDTSATIPDDLDWIDIGSRSGAAAFFGGIIKRVQIWGEDLGRAV